MANPVICIRDASLKNGQLLIKDLWPNRSQANPVLDPVPQGPRYLRVVENAVPVVANDAVSQNVSGLTAYLLATVDVAAGGANPSLAQAKAFASAIIVKMRAGESLSDIDGVLDGVVVGTGLSGTGASTATTQNILNILGGASFTLSAGTSVDNSYLSAEEQSLAFDSSVYQAIDSNDSSFHISLAEGDLSKAKLPRDYRGTALDPMVVVYNSDGSVL